MMPRLLMYGGVPVPYTASWTGEESHSVGPCRHADGRVALRQIEDRGVGKPNFGKPHSDRQREAIARGLCDVCGRPLRNRTKISLSHARWRTNAVQSATGILQVEPLLDRECARRACLHCPSLKRDIAAGTLMIRQVLRYRVQLAVMAPEFIAHYVPDYQAEAHERIIGHAKVELLDWIDRDAAWLGCADA